MAVLNRLLQVVLKKLLVTPMDTADAADPGEDQLALTVIPSLGGYGVAELEPFESQQRGFQHGHFFICVSCAAQPDVSDILSEHGNEC